MPRWYRVPKGTYTRDTPDWFARQRARVGIQFNPFNLPEWPFTPAVGLVNSNTQNVYFHVTALTMFTDGDPGPPVPPVVFPPNPFATETLFAKYSTGIIPLPDPNNSIWGPATALYSDAAMPPGSGVAGASQDATFTDNSIFNPASWNDTPGETIYGRRDELAIVAPNTTWEIYGLNMVSTFFVIDYYWLSE